MGKLAQFGLLMWKNYTLMKRKKVNMLLEVLLPTIFSFLLIFIRGKVISHPVTNSTHWSSFDVSPLPPTLCPDPESISCSPWRLFYSPDTNFTDAIMRRTLAQLNAKSYRIKEITPFYAESAMVEMILADYEKPLHNTDILAAVVFDEIPMNNSITDVSYRIRFPYSPRMGSKDNTGGAAFKLDPYTSDNTWKTAFRYPPYQHVGPRDLWSKHGGQPGYYIEGFLSLQYALDMSIIDVYYNTSHRPKVRAKRFPYPPYMDDSFLLVIQQELPLFLILSFIFSALSIVRSVVDEKEKKLKETMKLMGLSNWLHWSAWFVRYLLFLLFSSLIMTLLLSSRISIQGKVIGYTSPYVFYLFLSAYGVATISYCFMISVFFNKANTAAAAAGILFIVCYVPYFFLQPRYATLSWGVKVITSLAFNVAVGYGGQIIGLFEGTGAGIQWSTLNKPVTPDDQFTMLHVVVMLYVDAIIYFLVTWYVEAVFPGEFGIPKVWNFPFTLSYWLSTAVSSDITEMPEQTLEEQTLEDAEKMYFKRENYEQEPLGVKVGVQIKNLRKVFGAGKDNKVIAVDGLEFNMYERQITVLLGHNGAGKSTTISIITGFLPPTSGTALVNGHDIHTDIEAVRRSLGLCPQHDVLFDTLTVVEHLRFFARLKGYPEALIDEEVDKLVADVGLSYKCDEQARHLSGGMKRKLSVAIALVGGSKVVILDEPTSGMDPEARRQTWDVLRRMRQQGRTILLTTHYMDEADYLGDRIAIMADGQLQCYGTPLFLKKKYGAGYHMIIVKNEKRKAKITSNRLPPPESAAESVASSPPPPPERKDITCADNKDTPTDGTSSLGDSVQSSVEDNRNNETNADIAALVERYVPDVWLDGDLSANELAFILPHESKKSFSKMFAELESRKEEFDIESFGISVTTMEEVFIRVGERAEDRRTGSSTPDRSTSSMASSYTFRPSSYSSSYASSGYQRINAAGVQSMGQLPLFFYQFRAMFVKRFVYTLRKWTVTLSQLAVPLLLTISALVILKTRPSPNASPSLLFNLTSSFGQTLITTDINDSALTQAYLATVARQQQQVIVNLTDTDMESFLESKGEESVSAYNLNYLVGCLYNRSLNQLVAYFNDQSFHTPAISLNLVDNMLVRYYDNTSSAPYISAFNDPLPKTTHDTLQGQVIDVQEGFAVAFNVIFGMSFVAASFVVFLIHEKTSRAKHNQLVSGARHSTYWIVTFVWDTINYSLPCLLLLATLAAFRIDAYSDLDRLGDISLLFTMYGWSMLPLMYCMSFMFESSSTGLITLTMFNILTGVATVLCVNILNIPQLHTHNLSDTLRWIFMAVFPNYCLGQALNDLYTNFQILKVCNTDIMKFMCESQLVIPCCKGNCGDNCLDYSSNYLSLEAGAIGRHVLFLGLQGIVYFMILIVIEMKLVLRIRYAFAAYLNRNKDGKSRPTPTTFTSHPMTLDSDVLRERDRLLALTAGQLSRRRSAVVMRGLTKRRAGVNTVDGLSVEIARGECFGLLGVNGAGKTTTFRMLTGDTSISGGLALVSGHNVATDIHKVRKLIGYCPQFDALTDEMTGRETLTMYARLRGINEARIKELIIPLVSSLLLQPHIDKLVKTYSGGNKRKLSTAVALIGDPPVVFLDEPTTGMDPVARRRTWDVLAQVRRRGQTLVLTSHSMEECEILCTRLAIMVNGQLRCLGSTQHLKSKFSRGYTLIARVRPSLQPMTQLSPESYNCPYNHVPVMQFIKEHFGEDIANLRDSHAGLLHYHIASCDQVTWTSLFDIMERAIGLALIDDYSISQTTLEQVFINLARSQLSPEEVRESRCDKCRRRCCRRGGRGLCCRGWCLPMFCCCRPLSSNDDDDEDDEEPLII